MMFAQHITPNFQVKIGKTPAPYKSFAFMATDVKTQISALRKNISDYSYGRAFKPLRQQLPNRYLQAE